MSEGQALLESWAGALEGAPLLQLVESFAGTDHVESLRGASGSSYELRVRGFWGDEERPWRNDFYVVLALRPTDGLRRLRARRAILVAPFAEDKERMQPVFWVQRAFRDRDR